LHDRVLYEGKGNDWTVKRLAPWLFVPISGSCSRAVAC
jgi:hypothetical protein